MLLLERYKMLQTTLTSRQIGEIFIRIGLLGLEGPDMGQAHYDNVGFDYMMCRHFCILGPGSSFYYLS